LSGGAGKDKLDVNAFTGNVTLAVAAAMTRSRPAAEMIHSTAVKGTMC